MSPNSNDADLVIVGAGAAGLMAAIAAGRHARPRIVVLEGARRLGAKVLISGGGRCNVTNRRVVASDFNGGSPRVIARVLKGFTVEATVGFFAALGVGLHEEVRGKLFPDSEKARTVLDALVAAAESAGARIELAQRVEQVERRDDGFTIETPGGAWRARRLVLATGGRSVPKTGSDGHGLDIAATLGHTIVPTTPALVPLLLSPESFHARVSGVAHDVTLEVLVDGVVAERIAEPMLWTHLGVSGPAALDASRHWHRAELEGRTVTIRVNVCGGRPFDEVERAFTDTSRGRTMVRAAVEPWMPASVAAELLAVAGVDASLPLAQLPREARRRLVHTMTALPLDVTGSRGYTHAEATAGGVSLAEIEPATMASRACPGLYLAGEMLDVDGRLGGFNFQWAWASGYVAGQGASG